EVTSTHRLWRTETKNPQRIGTGIIHEGLLYISNANGLFECLDVETGTVVWRQRLGGNLWGSIVMGDGNLYVGNLEGDTFVLRSGPKFELLSKNSVQEESYAAVAISQGDVFLRTYEHLYCISGSERP
ncbi:MAG: PQQ-binding-like beta-propeller repeat protein, partial [Planctomycetota bacterium]|nr:PQQ-binding-like beta-propeller repeat protein [Planctomycetota bacterium]